VTGKRDRALETVVERWKDGPAAVDRREVAGRGGQVRTEKRMGHN
jgi:hypothetical protein